MRRSEPMSAPPLPTLTRYKIVCDHTGAYLRSEDDERTLMPEAVMLASEVEAWQAAKEQDVVDAFQARDDAQTVAIRLDRELHTKIDDLTEQLVAKEAQLADLKAGHLRQVRTYQDAISRLSSGDSAEPTSSDRESTTAESTLADLRRQVEQIETKHVGSDDRSRELSAALDKIKERL